MNYKIQNILTKLQDIKDELYTIDSEFIAEAFPRNRNINTYKIQKEINLLMKWVEEEENI